MAKQKKSRGKIMLYIVENPGMQKVITYLMYGGSGASYLFGPWFPLIGILLTFSGLDIITGVAKGFYDKSLRSRKMSQGMIAKAMMFVVVIIANMLDVTLSGGLPVIKTAVVLFYISYEGMSILENLGQMNVPLPPYIKDRLIVLKDEKGEGK
jgi:toxin secretion/phage lysis holin